MEREIVYFRLLFPVQGDVYLFILSIIVGSSVLHSIFARKARCSKLYKIDNLIFLFSVTENISLTDSN
jgi:hypothetical protein